jgi:hypothetical protein
MLAAERPAPLKNVRRDISIRQAPPSPLGSVFGSAILGAPLMSCVCLSLLTSPAPIVGVLWHPQMVTNDVGGEIAMEAQLGQAGSAAENPRSIG